jgi:hypothetical protein
VISIVRYALSKFPGAPIEYIHINVLLFSMITAEKMMPPGIAISFIIFDFMVLIFAILKFID